MREVPNNLTDGSFAINLRAMPHTSPIQLHAAKPGGILAHIEHDRLMDCVHCGLCLAQCPTYAELGQEADSPRGRIYLMRALAEGRTELTPKIVEHFDLCLGCRACETACPSGVQYGALIEGTRAFVRESHERSRGEKLIAKVVETVFPNPNLLEAALLPVRVLRRSGAMKLLHKSGLLKALKLDDMEALLPKLPPMQTRMKFAERWRARGEKQASVGMITGCVMQVMQSNINAATARMLCKAGCDVAAPRTQNCCGALHAHSGAMDEAKKLAQRNIEVFEKHESDHGALDAIIINAAGCGAALKEYGHWFAGDDNWENRARDFSAKVKDVSEFLALPKYKSRLAVLISEKFVTRNSSIVTYHDACHLAHGQGVRTQPRALLDMIPGLDFAALNESEMCCGSAGIYNITQPEMAMRLLERKMKNINDSKAKTVVTGNPGCMMQLQLGAKKTGQNFVVKHPVEVLDEATR